MSKAPYTLTKTDIAAFRGADHMVVSLDVARDAESVRLTKKGKSADPFAQDVDYFVPAPVDIRSGRETERAICVDVITFYHSQSTMESTAVHNLRVGDEIRFTFYPDAMSNQHLARAGLHGDVLLMIVYRGNRRMEYEIAHSVSPTNSARMCRGIPNTSYYDHQTKESA